MRLALSTFTIATGIVVFAGCERQQPRQNEIRLEVSNDSLPERRPILGKIWFIKTIGRTEPAPPGTVAAIANWKPITEIVDSISFNEEGTPSWKLPLGWSQKTIVDNRSFELSHDSGSRIEITSSLVPDISRNDTIKSRLDVWRDELGLPSLTQANDWTDAFETGINKSTSSGRTRYIFQFAQAATSDTSMTILGAVVPHPDPMSSK